MKKITNLTLDNQHNTYIKMYGIYQNEIRTAIYANIVALGFRGLLYPTPGNPPIVFSQSED